MLDRWPRVPNMLFLVGIFVMVLAISVAFPTHDMELMRKVRDEEHPLVWSDIYFFRMVPVPIALVLIGGRLEKHQRKRQLRRVPVNPNVPTSWPLR